MDLRWLDVPIQEVRTIVLAPQTDKARAVIKEHAAQLVRQRRHLSRQIEQCTRYAPKE